MATSSDWFAALAAPPAPTVPRWFESLGVPRGFCAGAPYGEGMVVAAEPAVTPASARDAAPDLAPEAGSSASDDAARARIFAEGEAAGRAAASAEAAAALAHARALRLNFRALDEAALGVLAEELAATVEALCAGVLGEYALDRNALVARCEAAAVRLGNGWQGVVLHLHPDDLAGLPAGALDGWQIASDPALERGGLRIEGPEGTVRDTPADWRRALAEAVRP